LEGTLWEKEERSAGGAFSGDTEGGEKERLPLVDKVEATPKKREKNSFNRKRKNGQSVVYKEGGKRSSKKRSVL